MGSQTRQSPGRLWRAALGLLLALASIPILLEGLVRTVLFWGWFTAFEPIAALRVPSAFACLREDEHWELGVLLERGRLPREPNHRDPLLGWRSAPVGPTYAHEALLELGSERPVLLFGDSYAQGVFPPANFQVLFEETRLAAQMDLVNYGCGGYGLDQIQLLATRALPAWTERDPVVLLSLLVDDDLDRCRLSFRAWPKPRYRLVDGEPVLERALVPTLDEHLAQAFPLTKWWSWRLLLHGGLLPRDLGLELCGAAAADLAVRPLCERLLEGLIADLRSQGLTFGFVLFYNRPSVERPSVLGWREELVLGVLSREGVPYVSTRGRLARHMAASGRPHTDYYYPPGKYQYHLTELGNRVVLEDMLQLIERLSADRLPLASFSGSVLPGKHSEARYFDQRLALRAGRRAPTEVRYTVGAAKRLALSAWSPAAAQAADPARAGSAALVVLVDGRQVASAHLAGGAAPERIELDVAGAEEVVIRVANEGPRAWQLVYLEEGAAR